MWRLADPEETVYQAIRAGYRRFDSACDYGNEEATGRGIARALTDGIVKREENCISLRSCGILIMIQCMYQCWGWIAA